MLITLQILRPPKFRRKKKNILSITSKDHPNVKNPAFLKGKSGVRFDGEPIGLTAPFRRALPSSRPSRDPHA